MQSTNTSNGNTGKASKSSKSSNEGKSVIKVKKQSSRHKLTGDNIATIVLFSIFGVMMIIYIIVIFYMFDKQTGIFERYNAPNPPKNGFEILGEITTLTPTEFADRNYFYKNGVSPPSPPPPSQRLN